MTNMNVVLSVSDGTVLVEVVHPADVEGGEFGWRVLVDGQLLMTSTTVYTVSLDALRAGLDWWLR